MRFGVGIGGRLYTNFGPVRVDVATPIGRRKGESRIRHLRLDRAGLLMADDDASLAPAARRAGRPPPRPRRRQMDRHRPALDRPARRPLLRSGSTARWAAASSSGRSTSSRPRRGLQHPCRPDRRLVVQRADPARHRLCRSARAHFFTAPEAEDGLAAARLFPATISTSAASRSRGAHLYRLPGAPARRSQCAAAARTSTSTSAGSSRPDHGRSRRSPATPPPHPRRPARIADGRAQIEPVRRHDRRRPVLPAATGCCSRSTRCRRTTGSTWASARRRRATASSPG